MLQARPRLLYVGNKLSEFGFTPTGVEFLGGLLSRQGFSVSYAGQKHSQLARLWHMLKAATRVTTYDLLLMDVYSTRAFYYAVSVGELARFLNKPYILILRGGDLAERYQKSPQLVRRLFLGASRVVSVSLFLQEKFASLRQVDFIPNFIALENYTFKQRHRVCPRLLWVRSFHQIYNPELAVHVLAALVARHPDAHLTMVGPDKDGSMQHVKKLASQLGLTARLTITGKLSKAEWAQLAAGKDVFINTTNFDNMPVSVIEAMALGLPVVSTNAGGLAFLLNNREDSLVVDRGDLSGFVGAIEELVANPELASRLATAARAKAESFSEQRVAREWKALLTSIAEV